MNIESRQLIEPFKIALALISSKEIIKSLDLDYLKNLDKREEQHYLNVYSSKNDKILDDKKLIDVKRLVEDELKLFCSTVLGFNEENFLKITSSWANFASKGQGHTKHIHRNSIISGVIFIDVETSVPKIMFESPLPSWGIEWKRSYFNEVNSFGYDLNVKNGDLLFFPSHIAHHVPVNMTDNTRITISFDTTLVGPLYNEAGTLLSTLS